MKFRFPIVIIDEDFRSENTSGLGIRALAQAIESEGFEVLGVTSYGDLSQFAQQQSRASAFILSIDDEEFTPGPDLDPAVLNLRHFIEEVRRKNLDVPIYVYGETKTSRHIPNDILRELHGFIHMFEDTPEFVARHIIREAKSYLEGVQPPFFKALLDYAEDGSYSWHCPGHSGGVAFLKSPVGQMFHQFFGENMLRADVCNAVEELGQLLDHTGPVAESERNAARIFNADHCFFVTNGTSTSNKMVWHHTVAPGDVVVVDRNCHKSILHAIIMTGAVPVFLKPTRNHFGIIGPIPKEEFEPASIQAKIKANPLLKGVDAKKVKPRVLTLTQSTYDGVLYNTETIKNMLDGYVENLHFDEAWLPHAAFHPFYGTYHAMGKKRARPQHAMVYATQSIHKLLAGISQASHVLVQDSQTVKLDRALFNEAYLMHTSTSPQYSIIASCDVAAAMMEPPGGTALVEESIAEALDFRRAMRKVDEEYGADWWFKVWGPDKLVEEGIGRATDWVIKGESKSNAKANWHGFGKMATGFNMLDPIKSTIVTPGMDLNGKFAKTGIPASIVTKFLAEHGVVVEKTGLVQLLHHVHHRHHQGPLEQHADRAAAVQGRLCQEPADVAHPAGVLPEASALREDGAGRPVPSRARAVCQVRHCSPDHRHVPERSDAGHEAQRRLCAHCAAQDRTRGDRPPRGPHHRRAGDALPARHSAFDPGRSVQPQNRGLSQVLTRVQCPVPWVRDRHPWAGGGGRR
jgi:arginine decarboxylase